VILGLVIGKALGITLLTVGAVKVGLASLPGGVTWRQFFSASILAGIGFTMSLFISGAAFESDPLLQETAKLAILVASVVAAAIGSTLLYLTSPSAEGTSSMQVAAAAD
jgi:NhaA family Na+:H+ antiporter